MKPRTLVLMGLALFLLLACRPFSPPATSGEVAASSLVPVDVYPNVTMKNPAAVYCIDLGYEYQIVTHADGSQNGVCLLPDGQACSAWAFLRGQCGAAYSICARRGLETEVRSDGNNPFSREYAVCVDRAGTHEGAAIQSATEMADLMAKATGEKEHLLPDGDRRYGPQPPSGATAPPLSASDVSAAAPPAFDWRDVDGENWITPVKDQGMCGSCWAFGAVGALEAVVQIDLGTPNQNLDLSEQYLVTDCALYAGDCTGGWHTGAFGYIRDEGIPDEGCLPYGDGGSDGCTYIPGCGSICTYHASNVCSDYTCSDRCDTWSQRLQTLDEYLYVPADKEAIKDALIEYGPLAVAVSTHGSFGGDGLYRCPDNSSYNHIVVLVGYNDSPGYWILKNSHGTDYGEGGYYRVAYDTCAVQNNVYAVRTGLDAAGITLSPPGATGYGAEGAVVTYRPWVVNHTGEARQFDLSLSGSTWASSLSMRRTRLLADGESVRFALRVTVPADAADGDRDAVTVSAATGDGVYSDTATFATRARVDPQAEVSPETLLSTQAPGSTTTHALEIYNPSSTTLIFTIHQALPTGAALLLSLNETGGAELFLDSSGHGNHATCSGDSCPRAGVWSPRGRAAEFDGQNDRIVTPVTLDQSPGSPGATMAAWVQPTSSSTDILQVISTDDGDLDWGICSWGGYWHVFTGDGAYNTWQSVQLNQWQHVAAAFEPSRGRVRFYKNGVEYVIPHIGYETSVNPVVLGDNAGPWEQFFEGRIDEVRVYRYPLSEEQIQNIHQGSALASWLTSEPAYGRVLGGATRTIQLNLDASGLSPDTYSAQVSVVSTDPDDSRIDVPVTMVVADQWPEIGVAPDAFVETVVQEESLVRTLTISNTGTAELTFHMGTEETASAQVLDAYWITLEPTGGTVSPGGEEAIQVTLDTAGLPPDTYNGVIHVYSNDPLTPTLDVPVTLTVTEAATQFTVYLPIVLR